MMNKRKCTDCVKKKNKKEKQDARKEVLEKIYEVGKEYIKELEKTNDKEEIKRRENERKKMTPELTEKILSRDTYKCHYCDEEATTADHKKPIAREGETKKENLVACCSFCNNVKGNIGYEEFKKIKEMFTREEWIQLSKKYQEK